MSGRLHIGVMVALALMAVLGCAARHGSEPVARAEQAVTSGAAESRPPLLETVLANRSAFAAMLSEEAWLLAYTSGAKERVESLRKSSHPAIMTLEQFKVVIARSRVVFVSDVHDDGTVQDSIRRVVRWLRASGGRLDFVGLEFLYDAWS